MIFGGQPQPVSPAAFAASSAEQQAEASDAAGPPQHPAASPAGTALQTPVSGSTSSTRAAASLSPAISATIERTCSIARHGQKRRCAAIRLHAGNVEAGLGMLKFARAVRPDGAAAMLVGIDQRRQRRGQSSDGSRPSRNSPSIA